MAEGIRLCISGICGQMGTKMFKLAEADRAIGHISGIDLIDNGLVPVHRVSINAADLKSKEIQTVLAQTDVLLIFHDNPLSAAAQAKQAAKKGVAVVIGTTGFSFTDLADIRGLRKKTAIAQTYNFSLGMTVFAKTIRRIASNLPSGYHVEIVEEHHFKKLDAPSGTAFMLAQEICAARGLKPEKAIQCGRSGRSDDVRDNGIVGIQSVRGGSIAGIHEVIFAGPGETLRFKHEAGDPGVFAQGALAAVKWLAGKPAGIYTMADVYGLNV